MKVTIRSIMYGSILIALVSASTACNDTDGSAKTSDSVGTATAAVMPSDSATVVKAKKKKKGLTSVSGLMADSAKMVKDVHGVYNRAETAPEYPGGQAALSNYINKNLVYPQSAVDNGTSGTVQITFIVDEHGKIIDPKVTSGKQLGDSLADETLIALYKMPLWTPGTVHGKKVKTRMILPVTFELADAD